MTIGGRIRMECTCHNTAEKWEHKSGTEYRVPEEVPLERALWLVGTKRAVWVPTPARPANTTKLLVNDVPIEEAKSIPLPPPKAPERKPSRRRKR